MADAVTIHHDLSPRRQTFLTNILWSWAGVIVPLFTGLVLSPYIIRKLGAEGYGLWALTFSVIGYYGLLDLGFRSAVVRFTSHYQARAEYKKINELINTALAYLSLASIFLLAVTVLLSSRADRFFNISQGYRHEFLWLVFFVGLSLSLGLTWDVFVAGVEGFQRFDSASRIRILTMGLRSFGNAALLFLGYGLLEMGVWALITQLLSYVLYFMVFRRIFPAFNLSLSLVKFSTLKEIAAYGVHTFLAGMGTLGLEQSTPILIGYFLPVAFVGYYNFPLRLLQYGADVVGRAGMVVAPRTAELAAKGRVASVSKLGIFVNRYCFALYVPVAIVLLVYGRELIRLWVGSEFANYSTPVLHVLLAGILIALAGQFSSGSMLFGLGKHQRYAYSLLIEAVASIVSMIIVIPRYGIVAAALVACSLMVLNRGLFTPWLACRILNFPFFSYMRSIFMAPLLTALPVLALTYWFKISFWPGKSWTDLIVISVTVAVVYFSAAFFTCLEKEHRELFLRWVLQRLHVRAGAGIWPGSIYRRPSNNSE